VSIISLGALAEAIEELRAQEALLDAVRAGEGSTVAMTTADGVEHQVQMLVRTATGGQIGFQKQADGSYQVITDAAVAEQRRTRQLADRIRQRYAYHAVKADLQRQGYTVVEEKSLADDTIRLVARRWA